MSNILIFILVFNGLCFAQNFDKLRTSDQKTKVDFKRNALPPQSTDVEINVKKQDAEDVNNNAAENGKKNSDLHQNGNSLPDAKSKVNETEKQKTDKKMTQSTENNSTKPVSDNKELNKNNSSVGTSNNKSIPPGKNPNDHEGALLRAFYVFLGLTSILLIYFVFKAFRLRPGAPPPATVRKYGIVGRRSDMEMLPLPLAEEEDDDTLFEIGTHGNR